MSSSISQESPFANKYSIFHTFSVPRGAGTRSLRSSLNTAVSIDSPPSFKIKHVPVITDDLKTEQFAKGYHTLTKEDAILFSSPSSVVLQEKLKFDYQDFNFKGNRNDFDFSTLRPSHIVDLLADKRPDVKSRSPFFSTYQNKLKKEGFGLNRGLFTVDSNQRYQIPRYKEGIEDNLGRRISKVSKH